METNFEPPMPHKPGETFRRMKESTMLKLLLIGALILILLIPVAQINSVINEREQYRDQAIQEVQDLWGGDQEIVGPILMIPYQTSWVDNKEEVHFENHQAYFLPQSLNIKTQIDPEIRYRGIYQAPLYRMKLKAQGVYRFPDFSEWQGDTEKVNWDEAKIVIQLPDNRSIKESVKLKINDDEYTFIPGVPQNPYLKQGIQTSIDLTRLNQFAEVPFEFSLNLNGSDSIRVAPLGQETKVTMHSAWKDPSFKGGYLPDSREITPEGFEAQWTVYSMSRNYPQKFKDDDLVSSSRYSRKAEFWEGSLLGVDLLIPVDTYTKTLRATKYALLFIFLTFLTFFVFEVVVKLKVHPFQYFLVGSAICLFYLLLLSLSEHIGFQRAYFIASGGIVGMISFYGYSILKNIKRSLILSANITSLYVYLYVLLNAQDFALVMGSIGLFITLAVVMFVTRKIDWYTNQGSTIN